MLVQMLRVLAVKLLIRSGLVLTGAKKKKISDRGVMDTPLVPGKLKGTSFGLVGSTLVPRLAGHAKIWGAGTNLYPN